MKDRDVTCTKCFFCGRTAKKKIRWFSVNTKSHLCLAYCPDHGYFKGKARLKKTDDEKYYVVKTVKSIDEKEAADIREKKDALTKSAARNDIRKVKNEKRRIKSYFMDGQTKPKKIKWEPCPGKQTADFHVSSHDDFHAGPGLIQCGGQYVCSPAK